MKTATLTMPQERLPEQADRDVWRLNLELLPPQPSRTWAGSERRTLTMIFAQLATPHH